LLKNILPRRSQRTQRKEKFEDIKVLKKFNIKIQTLIEKKFFSVCSVISVVKITFISIGVYAFIELLSKPNRD